MSEVRIHLSREIIGDLWRHKLQVVLTLAVLITAFAVILVTNMTRGLTAKQNDLMAEEDRLNIEWRHRLFDLLEQCHYHIHGSAREQHS